MSDTRRCGRQPHVLHIHDSPAINTQLVPTSHLLPHVQQEAVVSFHRHLYLCLEDISLPHFLPATLCRRDVDHLLSTSSFTFCQLHLMICRVPFCHTIVVPKQSITLVGNHHGHGYLCIDLGKAPGKASHIGVPILKLPETEYVFSLG